MKTKEFFEKRLQAPLANHLNSWGSVDKTNKRVFLRVHNDCLKPNCKSPKHALLYDKSWGPGSSPGDSERLRHIDLLKQDYFGFAVPYETSWDGYRSKTKDFEKRFLLRLGKVTDDGNRVFARVMERIPVDAVVGTSANKKEEGELDELLKRDVPATVRQALVKARVGQGYFRDQVLQLWSFQCAVTGCAVQEVIRASHIKPWSESTDKERLDPYNGLPLVATLDALFDKHLIAFDAHGKMIVSSELSKEERQQLLPYERRLRRKPSSKTAQFLKEHSALLR